MPLTVVVLVGRRGTGTRDLFSIRSELSRALPNGTMISVRHTPRDDPWGVRIRIDNEGAPLPWKTSQAVLEAVYLPPTRRRKSA